MAEVIAGLAVASSIITVVESTGKLLRIGWECVKIYQGNAPEGLEKLMEELTLLHGLLTTLKIQFEGAKTVNGTHDLAVESVLHQPGGMMDACASLLKDVAATLDDILNQRGARLRNALTGHRITKRLNELITLLERFKTCLLLALHSDQYTLARAIEDKILRQITSLDTQQAHLHVVVSDVDGKLETLVAEVRHQTDAEKLMHQEKKARKALRWLDAPDFRANHVNARNLSQHGTGLWLHESEDFQNWMTSSSDALWLHAIPGAGKTILCSTVIDRVESHAHKQQDIAVIYFYFDFRDFEKQTASGLLVSLLHQLSTNLDQVPGELLALYDKYKGEKVRPPVTELTNIFLVLVRRYFRKVYVFLDALDECKQWDLLLPIIQEFISSRSVSLLMTSRNEQHIATELQRCRLWAISVEKTAVARDVELFVREQIEAESFLRELRPELKQDIIDTLVQGAKGMFRWVKCQLDSIRGLRRPKAIRKALTCLPDTLDETYERILIDIKSDEERTLLHRVLSLIVFAARPLTLAELAEAAVIEIGTEGIDDEDRFTKPEDLIMNWRSLIITTGEYVGLAHYSVQEYLKSERILTTPAKCFAVDILKACEELTSLCLTYIGYDDFEAGPCKDDKSFETRLRNFPFLDYAANHWFKHATDEDVQLACMSRFDACWSSASCQKWQSWLQVFCDQSVTVQRRYDTYLVTTPNPLYYTSRFGLTAMSKRLLQQGHNVNTQGGYFGNALQAAAVGTHVQTMKLLLDHEASIDHQNGYHGTALQAAANRGSLEAAAMLLHRKANPNVLAGVYGNALQSAARNGHLALVDLLLQHGADVHAVGGPFGFALQAAANNGYWEIAELLISRSADVNSQGGAFGNALQAASLNGRMKAAEVLLQHGADVNIQGGLYSNALVAASLNGHEDVVRLLADHGAHINRQNGYYANALQAAAINGHDDVVAILLEYGADVHVKGGMGGSALSAAARNGYGRVVAQLLEHKPDLDVNEGYYGSPLQAAARNGFTDVVKMLLDAGASARTPGGRYGNPLQAAASNGKSDIVKLLLQHDADVNQIGEPYHTALTAAAAFGHLEVVQQLLEAGADVACAGGKFESATNAATLNGWPAVVELLAEHAKLLAVQTLPSPTRQDSAMDLQVPKDPAPIKPRLSIKL